MIQISVLKIADHGRWAENLTLNVRFQIDSVHQQVSGKSKTDPLYLPAFSYCRDSSWDLPALDEVLVCLH